jgi:hypothetical protein
VLIAKPLTAAIARLVQCVLSPGGSAKVRSTSAATVALGTGALPGRRVLSRSKPSCTSNASFSDEQFQAGF